MEERLLRLGAAGGPGSDLVFPGIRSRRAPRPAVATWWCRKCGKRTTVAAKVPGQPLSGAPSAESGPAVAMWAGACERAKGYAKDSSESDGRTGELVRRTQLHVHDGLLEDAVPVEVAVEEGHLRGRCAAAWRWRPPQGTPVVSFPQMRQPAASAESHAAPSGPSVWDLGKNQARLLGQTQQALFSKR